MQLLAFLIPLIRYFHETVRLQMPIFISPHPYLSNSLLNSLNLNNIATDHGLSQIVDKATHGHNILDKFFTNRPDLFGFNLVIPAIKTKHRAVLVNCCDATPVQRNCSHPKRTSHYYDLREPNMLKLVDGLNETDWSDVCCSNDVNEMCEIFTETCQKLIDQSMHSET